MAKHTRLKPWGVLFVTIFLVLAATVDGVEAQDFGADPVPALSPRNQIYGEPSTLPLVLMPGLVSDPSPVQDESVSTSTTQEIDPEAYHNMVMQSFRDRTWEIYIAYSLGVEPNVKRLTANSSFDGEPRLNPGCTQIVFTSDRDGNREIYTMDRDGLAPVRLTNSASNDQNPVWSPDGLQIAYVSYRDGNGEIYVMNSDGSNTRRLTATLNEDFHPTYSPDGTQLAWIMVTDAEHGVIVVANADGTNRRVITAPLRFVGDLVWSPTGERMAFDYDGDSNGWNELGVVGSDGTNLRTIANRGPSIDQIAGNWSTAGEYLYYSQINYIYVNKQYYISTVGTYRISVSSGFEVLIINNKLDLLVDVQPTDISLPSSQIGPLPAFSRADGFTIPYSTYDPGPAGVYALQLEYRYAENEAWQTLANLAYVGNLGSTQASGTTGKTFFVRGRALDYANHWEEWPAGNGDAWTKLFKWLITGKLVDNRGYPLPAATINITPTGMLPVQTDTFGEYRGIVTASGTYTLSGRQTGYGIQASSALEVQMDRIVTGYLPDIENWISNGDFEDQTDSWSNWRRSGAYTPTIAAGATGDKAVHLGMTCSSPCFGPITNMIEMDTSLDVNRTAIGTDNQGTVYILFGNRYVVRNSSGIWSQPAIVGAPAGVFPGVSYIQPELAIDTQGGVHAIVSEASPTSGLVYYYKPPGGGWTGRHELTAQPEDYQFIDHAAMAVNKLGVVAVMYGGAERTYYTYQSAQGVWSEPIYFGNDAQLALAVTSDNRFHALLNDSNLYHWTIPPTGAVEFNRGYDWFSPGTNADVRTAAGADGSLHVLLGGGELRYLKRSPMGMWSEPQLVGGKSGNFSMAIDSSGVIHVVNTIANSLEPVTYFRRGAYDSEFVRYELPKEQVLGDESVGLTVDRHDTLHLAEVGDGFSLGHRESMRWPHSGLSQVESTATVPVDAHEPTLAFMARAENLGMAPSAFEVSISGTDNTQHTVFSTTLTSSWQPQWVSLNDWAGQTVTLTFSLSATSGRPIGHVWIDSVSAGEWLTPVITEVIPSKIDPRQNQSLTLRGLNFPSTAIVRLGDLPLENVQVVNSNTVQATVPAGTAVGWHYVTVTSNQGHIGASPTPVEVGKHLFMPIVRR